MKKIEDFFPFIIGRGVGGRETVSVELTSMEWLLYLSIHATTTQPRPRMKNDSHLLRPGCSCHSRLSCGSIDKYKDNLKATKQTGS